jgi:hypothetical protein
VARVSQKGVVTPVGAGVTTVTATVTVGSLTKSDSFPVVVEGESAGAVIDLPAQSVTLAQAGAINAGGQVKQLPEGATAAISYLIAPMDENTAGATVDPATGVVTATQEGVVRVTAVATITLADSTTRVISQSTEIRVEPAQGGGGYTPVMSDMALSPDLTGDGRGEVLAVHKASGELRLFRGTAAGFSAVHSVPGPTGLADSKIYGPGDWSNDGNADVAAIDTAGDLWLHKGDGRGGVAAARTQLGNGWTTYTAIPAGDLTGDGQPDLLGVDNATGLLYLYKWQAAAGAFSSAQRVGNGWQGWQLHAAGDLNGDGRGDIIGIDSRGDMFCYAGSGSGTFQKSVKCGNGWGAYELAAGASLDGDRLADIVGRDNATGDVYFYQGRGQGSFATKKHITIGW